MVYLNLYGKPDKFKGQNKDVLYYTKYIEFNKVIEFRILDKQEVYKNRIIPFSVYAKNMNDVYTILEKYGSKRYIVYNSSNTRDKESRLDADVTYRRVFYFDVEFDGEKPPLTNKDYYLKLLETTGYLRNKLKEEGLKICLVKETGRGFLVGIKIKPLRVNDGSKTDKKFIFWFKKFVERHEPRRPHKEIKFSDGVFNLSRIEGSPLFRHMKYEEQPLRRVIYLDDFENDMQPVLQNIKLPKRNVVASKYSKKYNSKTIWKCPEWRLLAEHQDLPEGDLHTKIITMLKILFRDNGLVMEDLTEALSLIGYNEAPDIPDPEEYHYTPKTYDNWCLKNYEYCLKKKIKMINYFKGQKSFGVKNLSNELWEEKKYFYTETRDRTLETFTDILNYIKEFNTKTGSSTNTGQYECYRDKIMENVERLCFDKKLIEYIKFNDLFKHIYFLEHSFQYQEGENPRSI